MNGDYDPAKETDSTAQRMAAAGGSRCSDEPTKPVMRKERPSPLLTDAPVLPHLPRLSPADH